MESRAKLPILMCLLLFVLSLFVLTLDTRHWKTISDNDMRQFQQLAGGLGMGAVTTPVWSVIEFDPRLQSVDESTLRPLPGGYSYSPTGTSSVTCFKEMIKKEKDR